VIPRPRPHRQLLVTTQTLGATSSPRDGDEQHANGGDPPLHILILAVCRGIAEGG